MKLRFDRHARRKLFSHGITVASGLTILAVLYPLASILYESATRGGRVLFQLTFVTAVPPNGCSIIACKTVGVGPAIQGTLILIGIGGGIALLVGIPAAIFASEYRTRGLGRAISFTADVLAGIPSIIMGVFIYSYFVLYDPTITFSAITGGLALSAIMIPIVVRTTEEALHTVPNSMREAALALGISKWRTTLRIVLVAALPGVLTGVLLAVMRGAGEAAPLLFTAAGSNIFFQGLNYRVAALPLLIYNFAESPYSNQVQVAWGATLLLISLILIANVFSRYMLSRMVRKMSGGA